MKRLSLLTLLCIMLLSKAIGQLTADTVAIGPGYGLQSWYGLSTGNETHASKTEWDIAFDLSPQGSSILFNTVSGGMLWQYPHADTTGWASLDTTGIGSWEARWNSDTSWAEGAFSRYLHPSDPFDLGWGVYSTFTHYVTGDSLYVVQLANGSYKKLWIRQLATGAYTFRHADLNGANSLDRTITKSAYTGKEFVYYSLQNDVTLDREPLAAEWDLLFTQYTAFIPSAYSVSGLLVQDGIEVAKVTGVADVSTYSNYGAATFGTAINVIGYDWKAFTGSWVIEDSLLYFLRKPSGEVWKLVFTGFSGSANGEFRFSKELMNPTSVDESQNNARVKATVFPNPAAGRFTLQYALERPSLTAEVIVRDLSGRVVYQAHLSGTAGSHVVPMDLQLAPGMYLLDLNLSGQSHPLRLVIQ